mmetsp:Transcript_28446/g.71441  ORF Transcript_28446/g.71441 Transcript_28446/m.71441 type:complete len:247 (-) Transcript_28446:1092-1832(-)
MRRRRSNRQYAALCRWRPHWCHCYFQISSTDSAWAGPATCPAVWAQQRVSLRLTADLRSHHQTRQASTPVRCDDGPTALRSRVVHDRPPIADVPTLADVSRAPHVSVASPLRSFAVALLPPAVSDPVHVVVPLPLHVVFSPLQVVSLLRCDVVRLQCVCVLLQRQDVLVLRFWHGFALDVFGFRHVLAEQAYVLHALVLPVPSVLHVVFEHEPNVPLDSSREFAGVQQRDEHVPFLPPHVLVDAFP